MYRYFFRFVVITLTILSVNLITSAITAYMVSYKNHYRPEVFTFLAMGITVVIFYPLFIKLEDWVKVISVMALKGGKSVAGKYMGLLFTFAIALVVLAYFYAKMWYHVNLFSVMIH